MSKHLINWKTVTFKDIGGDSFDAEIPTFIDHYYRGALLSRILDMPRKKPISFMAAVRTAGYRYFNVEKVGHARGETQWFLSHFVEWISELGYHIELTGDEFELHVSDDLHAN